MIQLITTACIADTNDDYRYTSRRTVEKTFAVSPNCFLNVTNKYGQLKIVEWDRNEISFKIQIEGRSDNEDVAKLIERNVVIEFQNTSSQVTATTIYNTGSLKNNRSQMFNGSSITINYTVMVPKTVQMTLDNKYGNVIIGKTNKPLDATVKYGNLTIDAAKAAAKFDIKYGDISMLEGQNVDLELKYGKARIERVGKLSIVSGYSTVTVEQADGISGESKYDKYRIGSVGVLSMPGTGYTNFQIRTLSKSLALRDIRYGDIKIENVKSGLEFIDVTASYTDVSANFESGCGFRASLSSNYGNIRLSGISITTSTERYTEYARGTVGNGSGQIDIISRYGDISLTR